MDEKSDKYFIDLFRFLQTFVSEFSINPQSI